MKYKYKKGQLFRKRLNVPKDIIKKIYSCSLSFSEYIEYRLDDKIPITSLGMQYRNIVEKFGIEKCKDLDWELIEQQNLFNDVLLIDSYEDKPNNALYEMVQNHIDSSLYSTQMKSFYSDRLIEIYENDKDKNLKEAFNNGKLNLKDIILNWNLFKDKNLNFCLSNDENNKYNITDPLLKSFMLYCNTFSYETLKDNCDNKNMYELINKFSTLTLEEEKEIFIEQNIDIKVNFDFSKDLGEQLVIVRSTDNFPVDEKMIPALEANVFREGNDQLEELPTNFSRDNPNEAIRRYRIGRHTLHASLNNVVVGGFIGANDWDSNPFFIIEPFKYHKDNSFCGGFEGDIYYDQEISLSKEAILIINEKSKIYIEHKNEIEQMIKNSKLKIRRFNGDDIKNYIQHILNFNQYPTLKIGAGPLNLEEPIRIREYISSLNNGENILFTTGRHYDSASMVQEQRFERKSKIYNIIRGKDININETFITSISEFLFVYLIGYQSNYKLKNYTSLRDFIKKNQDFSVNLSILKNMIKFSGFGFWQNQIYSLGYNDWKKQITHFVNDTEYQDQMANMLYNKLQKYIIDCRKDFDQTSDLKIQLTDKVESKFREEILSNKGKYKLSDTLKYSEHISYNVYSLIKEDVNNYICEKLRDILDNNSITFSMANTIMGKFINYGRKPYKLFYDGKEFIINEQLDITVEECINLVNIVFYEIQEYLNQEEKGNTSNFGK